tara:strand:+ start:3287 stop:3502 length:216 start_codon:yes stop_codon:yes gene_type:complete
MAEHNYYSRAIIRLKDVLRLTGLSRTTLYEKLNPRSSRYDPSFPKRVSLGERAVGWKLQEVEEWIDCTRKI